MPSSRTEIPQQDQQCVKVPSYLTCLLYSVAQWDGILYAASMASLLTRFGRAVRRFRERTLHSQERFANTIGIHRSYMWSIERGRANPSLDVIARIARGLGIPIS